MRKTYVLVSYDISDDNVRTKLAKRLKDFGQRAQFSVFEAEVTPSELQKLRRTLARVRIGERDSIRLYWLCGACRKNGQIWGVGKIYEDPDYVVL